MIEPGAGCRRVAPDDWVRFLLDQGFVPMSHLTLTFDLKRQAVSVEGALWYWRRLVQAANERVGGRRYRDKWGHSYFGYVVGVEYHKSGAVHLHALIDNRVDYTWLHEWWEHYCGWVWVKRLDGEFLSALKYVVKYVVKTDQAPSVWLQRRRRVVGTVKLSEDFERENACPPSQATPADHAGAVKAGVHSATRRAAPSTAPALTAGSGGEDLGRQGRLL